MSQEQQTYWSFRSVLVSILGHKGRIPLLFAQDELEPGYVHGVVRDTVDRFGF